MYLPLKRWVQTLDNLTEQGVIWDIFGQLGGGWRSSTRNVRVVSFFSCLQVSNSWRTFSLERSREDIFQ
jgi:hypothetical protein